MGRRGGVGRGGCPGSVDEHSVPWVPWEGACAPGLPHGGRQPGGFPNSEGEGKGLAKGDSMRGKAEGKGQEGGMTRACYKCGLQGPSKATEPEYSPRIWSQRAPGALGHPESTPSRPAMQAASVFVRIRSWPFGAWQKVRFTVVSLLHDAQAGSPRCALQCGGAHQLHRHRHGFGR